MLFSNLDIFIVIFYCIGIVFLAQSDSLSQLRQEKAIGLSEINIKIESSLIINTLIIYGISIVSYFLLW